MTICPACHNVVPDAMLMCPTCVQRNSAVHIRRRQFDPLRKASAGEAELTIRSANGKKHAQMYGFEVTFCGEPVHGQMPSSRMRIDLEPLTVLCPQCREAIESILSEAQIA